MGGKAAKGTIDGAGKAQEFASASTDAAIAGVKKTTKAINNSGNGGQANSNSNIRAVVETLFKFPPYFSSFWLFSTIKT